MELVVAQKFIHARGISFFKLEITVQVSWVS